MKYQATLLALSLLMSSTYAVQSDKMPKLSQVSSKAKLKTKTRTKAQSKVKAHAKAGAAAQVWPNTLTRGAAYTTDVNTRDFMYEAYCRCVSPDYTEGISICNTGCGDPTTVCTTDFGCEYSERSCNADQCTCKPDGIDTNTMTYAQCTDQCALAGMVMLDNTLEAVQAASNTGCNINGYETWIHTDGATELPDSTLDCTDDNEPVDSYGDTCEEWYIENPQTCGDYDTEDFTASVSCCACKWDDLSTDLTTFDTNDFQQILLDNFAVFFTKDNCEYCHWAINFMSSIGYHSTVIDFDTLDNTQEAIDYVSGIVEHKVVPVLFINHQYIGGWTQLKDLYTSGTLATMYHMWNMDQVTCVDDNSVSDSYDDTCSTYYTGDNVPDMCGQFDTDLFKAAEACCNCM